MDTPVLGVQTATASSGRLLCWLESLILGLGVPAAIWVVSKLISISVPAAVHGSAWAALPALDCWRCDRRMVLCNRALVCIADPRILLQRSRRLALGNMARLGHGAPICSCLLSAAIFGSCPECTFLSHMRSCRMDFISLLRFFWESPPDSVKKYCFAPF